MESIYVVVNDSPDVSMSINDDDESIPSSSDVKTDVADKSNDIVSEDDSFPDDSCPDKET